MNIAASLISLNEEEYIFSAIESLGGVIDEIYLVDGGSTDKTLQVAFAAAKKIKAKLYYEVIEWPHDFARQRNSCLRLMSGNVDWWLRLDCDEALPKITKAGLRPTLEALPGAVTSVRLRQVNLISLSTYSSERGGWETWPRIFQGKEGWEWTGSVHEHCSKPNEIVADLNMPVVHYGWLNRQRRLDREIEYGMEPGSLADRTHMSKPVPFLF